MKSSLFSGLAPEDTCPWYGQRHPPTWSTREQRGISPGGTASPRDSPPRPSGRFFLFLRPFFFPSCPFNVLSALYALLQPCPSTVTYQRCLPQSNSLAFKSHTFLSHLLPSPAPARYVFDNNIVSRCSTGRSTDSVHATETRENTATSPTRHPFIHNRRT